MSPRSLSCAEALGLADERHDRDLAPDEAAALSAHLTSCASCRTAAAGSDRVHGGLLAMDAPAPSSFFTDEVVARLDRAPGPRTAAEPAPVSGRLLRGATALAGTGVVAALAVLVLPLDAAAETVGTLVPSAAVPLPAVPPVVTSLVESASAWLPPWAAAVGAAAAVAGILLQAALFRRR